MTLRFDPKQPGAAAFFALDFSDWLAAVPGDTILLASVSAAPAGLAATGAPTVSGGLVTQQYGGGLSGTDYALTYTVITALNRTDVRTAMVFCGTPAAPAGNTVSGLGARALRKLGLALVADAVRPGEGATLTSADVAARALLQLGIPVAESDRPAAAAIVSKADLAARALRAVGIDPAAIGAGTASGVTYDAPGLATAVLLKLAVIASDETPSATDLAEAQARVTDVHDMLNGLDFVSWPVSAVPAALAEFYIIMAAQLVAPQFGKPAAMDAFAQAQAMLRQQALSGAFGVTLAEAKAQEAHEALNAAGLVAWTADAVPAGVAAAYVQLTASLLAPIYGYQQDAPGRQADRAASDAAVADVRRASVVAGAQARAQAAVEGVQGELNDLGLAAWSADAIPASLGDAMAAMAAAQLGPQFGKEFDAKSYALHMDRVRRVSMGGPAGQALAEAKIRAVQVSLEARGRARWTLWDVPAFAEEPLVLKAAALLAPECGMKADPAWDMQAEMELMRIVMLPSDGRPVRAAYF